MKGTEHKCTSESFLSMPYSKSNRQARVALQIEGQELCVQAVSNPPPLSLGIVFRDPQSFQMGPQKEDEELKICQIELLIHARIVACQRKNFTCTHTLLNPNVRSN